MALELEAVFEAVAVEAASTMAGIIQDGVITAVVVVVVSPDNMAVGDGLDIPRILAIIPKKSGTTSARLSVHVFPKLDHKPNRVNPEWYPNGGPLERWKRT